MRIYKDVYGADEIRSNAWAGAISTLDLLTNDEIETILSILDDSYPEGMDETEMNDFWWFDTDFIAECLGYNDFETLFNERYEKA